MRRASQMTAAAAMFGIAGSLGGVALAGPAEQEAIRTGCLKSTNWTEKACHASPAKRPA